MSIIPRRTTRAAGWLAALAFCAGSWVRSEARGQSCTTTLSVGANLVDAASSAANGATLCLSAGDWGTQNLWNISRSGYVTIKSATGKTASMYASVGNSQYLRFENITFSGDVLQNSCSRHIQYIDCDWPGSSATLSNSGCSGSLDTLFDGCRFTNFDVGGGFEGRLSLVYGSGITIKNSYFGDGGASDGIQMVGGVSSVTVGPGNVFSGILESLCGAVHCDAIQLYGAGSGIVIEKNRFANGDSFIMAPDGSSGLTVRDNVFDGTGVGYEYKLQFGTAANLRFLHNTLKNAGIAIDSKVGEPASTNALLENSILVGSSAVKTTGGAGCTGCTIRYNLFDDNPAGTNTVIGAPTFIGGASPATWAGWQLAAGSLGKNSGNDGLDRGTTYYGEGVSSPPAPTNLRCGP